MPLHSDHLNYLILRYFQENGLESSAIAFHKEWHRPRDFRNPESFPFARAVKRNDLYMLVNEGLFLDAATARRRDQPRRYPWADVNPREPMGEEETTLLENGVASSDSRPTTSSGKRKDRPSTANANANAAKQIMRAPDEFPVPAPKRQRRTSVTDGGSMVNGVMDETMEIDVVTNGSPDVGAGQDNDAEAATTASGELDVEAEAQPARYDSMDLMTQTETKIGPLTSTMYWKLDKPGARVFQSAFNPDASDPKNASLMLTVGQSLCRLYDVPQTLDGTSAIEHQDDPHLPPQGLIMASAWHPKGHTAACAMQAILQLSDSGSDDKQDQQHPMQLILNHGRDHGSSAWDVDETLLQASSVVLCVRYSPQGSYLLVARTNTERGLVQIWKVPADVQQSASEGLEDHNVAKQPIAWCMFDRQLLDACWIGEDTFMVSGSAGLARSYRLSEAREVCAEDIDADNVAIRGLSELSSRVVETEEECDKLRFDAEVGVAIYASTEAKLMIMRAIFPESNSGEGAAGSSTSGAASVELPGTLTALAFQPPQQVDRGGPGQGPSDASDGKSAILGAAFEEGFAVLYRITSSFDARRNILCQVYRQVQLADGPAFALAWSHQGTHLAIGGPELVQVYTAEALFSKKTNRLGQHEPLVTWRPDQAATRNSEATEPATSGAVEDEDEASIEPSLSWSADGESLGFAHERQLAVIRFRPPLHSAAGHTMQVVEASAESVAS
ncbi:hypothetical protein BAUCODRAFT_35145 [Baudoinia panamericana UAMH 10762]|uniref:Uncharacterized protein n=1 Tax=Baudoinia panamericana (strain UAMH 10762) TaxID=717646 RepID=M2LLJ0_BAUPA|nr:uncharacterized protein BAUCODRAFT_35145 [Baudoinia panamericana UAMH 10762]EMC95152.1 hypothetical protein BAUCODRAFT_35145 [Baudoinia panamericana UAMH 10762]